MRQLPDVLASPHSPQQGWGIGRRMWGVICSENDLYIEQEFSNKGSASLPVIQGDI